MAIIKNKKEERALWVVSIILFLAVLACGFFLFRENRDGAPKTEPVLVPPPAENNSFQSTLDIPAVENPPKPPPVSMERLKTQGCVADGLLTEYNPDQGKFVKLINRSNCYYLHRAVETWREPPDFSVIEKNMAEITKADVVYGMFLAEAISTKDGYKNEDTGHIFDFSEMCHNESLNNWGEHTCKPTFSSKEYRNYLEYIIRKAIDLGVQSFTFGQIYMQESDKRNYAPEIVRDIRSYAKKEGVDIVIGAQTGSITEAKYLKLFDYIEGGVGIDSNGNIESGPCLSRKGSCWALLWNKAYAEKTNNVLMHLDWTGIVQDDLDVFARMTAEKRAQTLKNLYKYFTAKNMGFLMPYFGVLYKENGGCYGPKKGFYSPDNAYSCQDEDVINRILSEKP